MAKHYEYTHASTCRVSNMRCCKCGKPITGEYRYHETEHAYVPCHRECCPEDKMWAKLDKDRKARQEWEDAYEQACKEFLQKWGSFPEQECGYCSC